MLYPFWSLDLEPLTIMTCYSDIYIVDYAHRIVKSYDIVELRLNVQLIVANRTLLICKSKEPNPAPTWSFYGSPCIHDLNYWLPMLYSCGFWV